MCMYTPMHEVLGRTHAHRGASMMLWLEPRHTHKPSNIQSCSYTSLVASTGAWRQPPNEALARGARRTAGQCTSGIGS